MKDKESTAELLDSYAQQAEAIAQDLWDLVACIRAEAGISYQEENGRPPAA